jgi:hypothetical protein
VAPERTWSIASRVVTVDSQALSESSPHPHPVVGEVQEGFLHDVCGLAHAAYDPVGDREQQRPEVLVYLCSWLSGSILTCMFSYPDDAVFPSVTQIGDSSTLPLGGAPQHHPCCTYWRSLLEAEKMPVALELPRLEPTSPSASPLTSPTC